MNQWGQTRLIFLPFLRGPGTAAGDGCRGRNSIPSPYSRMTFLVIVLVAFPAAVSADLTDMKVYSPIVEKGDLQFELIGNVVIDDADEHHGFQAPGVRD